jgi:hypothetical protein
MRLPTPPEPAMVYINATGESTRCHNETQLIEYGIKCAETMREACAAEFDRQHELHKRSHNYWQSAAIDIRALEIENDEKYTYGSVYVKKQGESLT